MGLIWSAEISRENLFLSKEKNVLFDLNSTDKTSELLEIQARNILREILL